MRTASLLLLFTIAAVAGDFDEPVEMLSKAARAGDIKTAEMILAAGVNPNLPDHLGVTPLYNASASDENQVLRLLLAYHADPNILVHTETRRAVEYFPVTPLQLAVSLGNSRAAFRLIAAGASVEERGVTGRTALHFSLGHLDAMRLLIERGADVNARDAEGTSPLDDAVWRGSLDAVAILMAHGARLNEPETLTGATPLNEAAYRGKTDIVKYLLQFKPDLELPDRRGYSPLANAIRMGHEEAALLLLDATSRPTEQFLENTLQAAVKKDQARLVESLLDKGGKFRQTNLLEDAALRGSTAIVNVLLDHGTSPDQVNPDSGTTALYAAAAFGKAAAVEALLEHGAQVNLCGANRKTPYQAAIDGGFSGIALRIQLHGGSKVCAN